MRRRNHRIQYISRHYSKVGPYKPLRCKMCFVARGICWNSDDQSLTKDIAKSRIRFDEASVRRVHELVSSWGNPFNDSSSLVNIASGIEAEIAVAENLLEAHNLGTEALELFIHDRIESNTVPYYKPIKRFNLKTFAAMKVK